ncbi:hypothetical protein CI610_03332 [invertebrate metagenome]|uniref:GIY-YIG domain-containing protein n=1 Tax=invertebrate metagenome TaxID=1711999 RepID=A0A2H9T3E3_9ZZZZ
MFFKPTDSHQLLHKKSFHPKHSFKGIIKSQIIRFHRICTRESDFNNAVKILFRALRNRNYSYRFLRKIKGETLKEIAPKNGYIAEACNSKRCETCPFLQVTVCFYSSKTTEVFNMKQDLNCNSKNVIYLITCRKCDSQYVGQTSLSLRDRFTRHRFDIRHKKDKPVARHFNQNGHSLEHVNITPIEQVPDSSFLNEREGFWIDKLQTLTPHGINEQSVPNQILPFVITYNTTATVVGRKVREHYNKLQSEFPEIYKNRLVTAYRKNKNLQDLLVRSRLKTNM